MINYVQNIKNSVSKIDNVRVLVYLYPNNLKYNYSNHKRHLTFLVGIENVQKINETLRELKNIENSILYKINKEIDSAKLSVLYEEKFIEFEVVDKDIISDKIQKIRDFELLTDKDETLFEFNKNRVFLTREHSLDNDDFYEFVIDFFIEITKISVNIKDENILKVNILKQEIFSKLIKMINIYLEMKYGANIELNNYGYNIKTFLDKEYHNALMRILELEDLTQIWTYIFKISGLFRKLGLEIANNLGYRYPKVEDVNTMEFLRKIYQETGK